VAHNKNTAELELETGAISGEVVNTQPGNGLHGLCRADSLIIEKVDTGGKAHLVTPQQRGRVKLSTRRGHQHERNKFSI